MSTLYSTRPLPDGVVISGDWPDVIITWPGGKARGATKPEYDLWRKLEHEIDGQIKCGERVGKLESLLQQMLDVAENCDETGYADGAGFVDLDKLHAEVRAALKT